MEICPLNTPTSVFEPFSFPPPKTFFSTSQAYKLLGERKATQFDPKQGFFTKTWKISSLVVSILSLIGGYIAFLSKNAETFALDHRGDVVTPYKCVIFEDGGLADPHVDYCFLNKGKIYPYETTPDDYAINHTNTDIIFDATNGVKAFIATALTPPLLFIVSWIFYKFSLKFDKIRIRNEEAIENKPFDSLREYFKCASTIDEETETPVAIIPKLTCLSTFDVTFYQSFSFNQIRSLQKNDQALFKNLLQNKMFSKEQTIVFSKLEHLLTASYEKLKIALQNHANSHVFENEPRILEAFIQEVEKEFLTDDIKSILALKLGIVHQVFDGLEIKKRLELIELVAEQKYSFELAFRNLKASDLSSSEILTFRLFDEQKNPVDIEVSKDLLLSASSVFCDSLQQTTFNQDVIELETINPKYFKEMCAFLKTGKLLLTKEEDIFSLFEIANFYHIEELLKEIESFVSIQFLPKYEKNEFLKLFTVFEKLNLSVIPKTIDLSMSQKILAEDILSWVFTEEFLEYLKPIQEFSMPASLNQLTTLISLNLTEFIKNESFLKVFIKAASVSSLFSKNIFKSFKDVFQKNPNLLKSLWDEAIFQENESMQELITVFCDDPLNSHIVLANWVFLPQKIRNEIIQISDDEKKPLLVIVEGK